MKKTTKLSPEVRERTVRLVFERRDEHRSQWAAIESIASKIGCNAQTLCKGFDDTSGTPGNVTVL